MTAKSPVGTQDRLLDILGISRSELGAVAWSFAYFFCILSAYYMLRPVRDAMAIVGGVSNIPWLFTGTFTVMLLVSPVFGWIASRYPRKRFLPWIYYFFIANILVYYALFSWAEANEINNVWIGRSFFVWLSVFNLFVVTVFWSFMADIYSREQSRRLFGVISAGGSTGAFLGPIVTGSLVVPLGFKTMLPIAACLLIGAVYCIYQLRHWVQDRDDGDNSVESEAAMGGSAVDGVKRTFTEPYFSAMAVMLLLANFVGVAAYTYLAQVVSTTFENTDAQTQAFAWIDATINALSFVGQLLIVKHAVRKLGIGVTLALLPMVSIIGFGLLALNPAFAIMAGLQIVRRALTFGLTKPTSDMLYAIVSPADKYKVKNFIETVIYRGGDLIAVWAVRALASVGITAVSLATIPVSAVWLVLALWIGKEYGRRSRASQSAGTAEKEKNEHVLDST